LASRVVVPQAFPNAELRKYGAPLRKVKRYAGLKEDVYLADFQADPKFVESLQKLGVAGEDVLIVARPPASEALYHRFENELFDKLLMHLNVQPHIKIVLLPRTNVQRAEYEKQNLAKVIMPRQALDGANLIAAADLVVSAGGTMNREAAALGVRAASIYAGKWAAIDEKLAREGRLQKLTSPGDFQSLPLQKKTGREPRANSHTRAEVAKLIFDES